MLQTEFKNRVYELVRRIPRGKVATYGQLARISGHPRSARAVGVFLKMNPDIPRTPCHRVVSANGSLTGYSAGKGISTKKAMLLSEGVCFIGDRVDLTRSLWSG